MAHTITLIPGDGTGPKLTTPPPRVLGATGVPFNGEVQEAGLDVMEQYGTPLPAPVLESIRRNWVALKDRSPRRLGPAFGASMRRFARS